MVDRFLRTTKDRLIAPLVAAIPRWVSPVAITLLSLPVGLAAALLAATSRPVAALLLFAVNRVLDGLDGAVARASDRQSDFGGYLDIVVDFVVYGAVPVGVWWGAVEPLTGGWGVASGGATHAVVALPQTLALLALLVSFYVNAASWMYLAAILEKRGRARPEATSITMPHGLVEGTETIILYAAMIALPHHVTLLFAAMAIATFASVAQRVAWAARILR